MFVISTIAERAVIERAADELMWLDPSPVEAVDTKEETRTTWRLDAYTASKADAHGCVGILELIDDQLSASIKPVEDKDWVAVSLEGLPAVKAGPFVVAGAHELAKGHPGRIPIWVEAGPAFGTGHHGTTAGCLKAFDKVLRFHKPGRVLDVGTGSGILAIAALKVGAISAIGTDTDAESIRVARINGQNNKVGRKFRAEVTSGVHSASVQSGKLYDTIFANILAKPLISLSQDISAALKPGGYVILSGLLTHQEPLVRAAYRGRGLVLADRLRMDGWSTLVYRRPAKVAPRPSPLPERMPIDMQDLPLFV